MSDSDTSARPPAAVGGPTFREALVFWLTLGFINFGGPAGQIALMHRELVERRRWIPEPQFMRGLNFCMLLPGPEAQQLATYIGWRLNGIPGGVVAGVLFVVPSVFVLLALSWMVAAHGNVPLVSALLYGVQPVVVGLVLDALVRIGRRTLRHAVLTGFAVVAFIALQTLSVPFPLVVLGALVAGVALRRVVPAAFSDGGVAVPDGAGRVRQPSRPAEVRRAVTIAAIFLALWALPVAPLWLWLGAGDVIVREALFFTQAAFLTFGGAYAVLVYIADAAVRDFGWLTGEQMVQGLGLAESTPGPLIMVTQYVGFLAAWKLHPEAPLLFGAVGALVTTYVTFLPSFLFIFLGAPYIERIAAMANARAALVGVTAAVVGVIAHLTVFFSTSVLISPAGVDLFAVALAAGSFAILRRTPIPIPMLVLAGALLGAAWRLLPL